MALYKLDDLYPDYKDRFFDGNDVKGLDVYAGQTDEKIGTVHTLLLDDSGRVRYFVIDTGFWIFGKKVLLPAGRCGLDEVNRRAYAVGLTRKEQAEHLPDYDEDMTVDYDYEEQVRAVYRTPSVEGSVPVEGVPPVNVTRGAVPSTRKPVSKPVNAAPAYDYDQEPELYQTNEQNHRNLRLYEERLVADRQRHKTGEVSVSKRVETSTSEVSVPVQKEKIVIEVTSTGGPTQVTAGNQTIGSDETIHMDIHEETANIHKQTVPHQEINVRKVVEQDTVHAKETVRREELDIDRSGNADIDTRNRH